MAWDDPVDEDLTLHVALSKGDFVGTCLRCQQPTTGSYEMDEGPELRMKCVNCGFKQDLTLDGREGFNFLCTFTG